MKFHHVLIIVCDIENALKLYRDVLGFSVVMDTILPDSPGPTQMMDQETLDDVTGVSSARIRVLLLRSDEGMIIEMQNPINPPLERTPKENLRYGHTGIHELALEVNDIDDWYEVITDSGYEPQTSYVWNCAGVFRSFMFYDDDGNLIQLVEMLDAPALNKMGASQGPAYTNE